MRLILFLFIILFVEAVKVKTVTKTVTKYKCKTTSKHSSKKSTHKPTSTSKKTSTKKTTTTKATSSATTSTKTQTPTSSSSVTMVPSTTSSTSLNLPTNNLSPQFIGEPCGYNELGSLLNVTIDIQVCSPPVFCNPETCPPTLGSCVDNVCKYNTGYEGISTLPEAWATYYCKLDTGGCQGVTQMESVITTADKLSSLFSLPLCANVSDSNSCIGIAASSPMMVGNSQEALSLVWGTGLSEASKVCYKISAVGGSAIVALTDRCGGYCSCGSIQPGMEECGPCVSSPLLVPNLPCVAPNTTQSSEQKCDWCANNNHVHFDLDIDTYNHVCNSSQTGSCKFDKVEPVACDLGVNWMISGGGSGGPNTFNCNGVSPDPAQPLAQGSFCCNWGALPVASGGCE
jgi:hypothetical protein